MNFIIDLRAVIMLVIVLAILKSVK